MAGTDVAKGANDDPLAQITNKTTKPELMEIVKGLADRLRGHERARLSRLQEIEMRVRDKNKPGQFQEIQNVIVSATMTEWEDTIRFLGEFEDLLPTALSRLLVGGRALLGMDIEGDATDDDDAAALPPGQGQPS